MGEPAKKLSDDSLDDLGAVAPGSIDDLGAVDVPPAAGGPAPVAEPEHADEMATFEDFMSRGEPLRTRGRGIDAPVGATKGEAAVRGLGAGLTLRHGDEAGGYGAWLAGHNAGTGGGEGISMSDAQPGDIPRAAGRGADAPLSGVTDFNMERDAQRQADKDAEEGHPYIFGATELAGAGAPGTLVAPLSAAGGGAVLGGIHGEGASEADTAGGVLKDTAVGAATGAAGGKLAEVGAPIVARGVKQVAGALAKPAEALAEGAESTANSQRAAASGAYGADMKRLANDKGKEAIQRFGRTIEDEGIHSGEGVTGALPQSWGTYAKNANKVVEDAGSKLGQLGARARQSVTVDTQPMVEGLLQQAQELEAIPHPEAQTQAKKLLDQAAMLDARGPLNYGQAHKMRAFLDEIAWTETGAGNAPAAQRAREMAGQVRDAMMDAAHAEDPALAAEIMKQNQRYEAAIWTRQMADKRIAQESGNQIFSLPAVIAGSAGVAGHGTTGVALGVGAHLMKTRGHAALAGTARAVQNAAEAAGAGITAAAEPVGAMATRAAQLEQVLSTPRVSAPSMGMPSMANTESPREKRIAQLKEIVNGTGSRAADMATADPAHGQQLAQEPQGKERDMRYAHLVASDPAFRARERARSQEQEEE